MKKCCCLEIGCMVTLAVAAFMAMVLNQHPIPVKMAAQFLLAALATAIIVFIPVCLPIAWRLCLKSKRVFLSILTVVIILPLVSIAMCPRAEASEYAHYEYRAIFHGYMDTGETARLVFDKNGLVSIDLLSQRGSAEQLEKETPYWRNFGQYASEHDYTIVDFPEGYKLSIFRPGSSESDYKYPVCKDGQTVILDGEIQTGRFVPKTQYEPKGVEVIIGNGLTPEQYVTVIGGWVENKGDLWIGHVDNAAKKVAVDGKAVNPEGVYYGPDGKPRFSSDFCRKQFKQDILPSYMTVKFFKAPGGQDNAVWLYRDKATATETIVLLDYLRIVWPVEAGRVPCIDEGEVKYPLGYVKRARYRDDVTQKDWEVLISYAEACQVESGEGWFGVPTRPTEQVGISQEGIKMFNLPVDGYSYWDFVTGRIF